MKLEIKHFVFATLLAGVSSAEAAGYNYDLLVGFTDGVGNDVIYDLGAPSAVTNAVHTYNLHSLISSFDLNNVRWGAIGNTSATLANRHVFITTTGAPNPMNSGLGNTISTQTSPMYQNFATAGAGQSATVAPSVQSSWNAEMENPTLSTQIKNAVGYSPDTTGISSVTLYRIQCNNSAPVALGTLSLDASGVVTFTPPTSGPTQPVLDITQSGANCTISFLTDNGATYTLYGTNSAGLMAPVSTWPMVDTLMGNGGTKSFVVPSSQANQFYRVKAQ